MPRRSPRAAPAPARKGNSPALIISLVFMVLLSIALGVMLYLEKDKTKAAVDNDLKSKADSKKLEEQASEYRDYFLAKLRDWVGDSTLTGDDYAKIMDLDAKSKSAPFTEWFGPLRGKVEGDARNPRLVGLYNPNTGKTQYSIPKRLEDLENQLAGRLKEVAALKTDYENYKQQFNQAKVDELNALRAAEVKKAQDDAKDQMEKALKAKDDTIAAQLQKIQDVTREVEKLLADEKDKLAVFRKGLQDKYDEAMQNIANEHQELRRKYEDRQVIHFDQPRGQVVRVERAGEQVYISLGSDDKVRPQLTFSVYGKGPGGKPMPDPKATIEVVSVVGPRMSLARVTQMFVPDALRRQYVDPTKAAGAWTDSRDYWKTRSPLVAGDLIYNPVWDPNHRVHVALAGLFDLDGDGQDDLGYFRNLLREMGAEVVSYLDPRDLQIKGAMDYKTDFLIVGGMPATIGESIRDEKAAQAGGALVIEASKMQDEAIKKGIEVISLRRFLIRMGHNPNRVPTLKASPLPAAGVKKAEDKEDK